MMPRVLVTVFFGIIVSITAINRPVYKIVLTQKGYAQFLQYDVITPPLTEFTFCTWIRVYDLAEDQSIFTYVVNGNNRVIRLWLDSGGLFMKVSIDGKVTSSMIVDVVKDVWRHVCLSYQSDYGAWALYFDSRLVSCEAAASLRGFVLPGGGSVILGYGTADDGAKNGFEGEIFGANMILLSTIERNFTMKGDPEHEQKFFPKNKIKNDQTHSNYVILNDLLHDEIQNSIKKNEAQGGSVKSYNNFRSPHSFEEGSSTKKPRTKASGANSQEDFDFTTSDFTTTNKEKIDYWNSHGNSKFTFAEVYKAQVTKPTAGKLQSSATSVIPMVSEFETPPPPSPNFYFYKTQETQERSPQSIYSLSNDTSLLGRKVYNKLPVTELFDFETPPPVDNNNKVYGQWTSSRFAGTVLNYLKTINLKNRENVIKRVPQTIPLHRISDSHPYPSEFKLNILRPPPHFKHRKVVEKRYDIIRRDPQINVHILEDDLRLNIIKMHAETQPKKVEIKSRGSSKKRREHRFYRDAQNEKQSEEEEENSGEDYQPKSFITKKDRKNNYRHFVQPTQIKSSKSSNLPFLRSYEELIEDSDNTKTKTDGNSHDAIIKNLSQGNKWHNAKSYSNDYTPHKISLDYSNIFQNQEKAYPSLRLKYVPNKTKKKIVAQEIEPSILYARRLATRISNQSFTPQDTVSILKYNEGNLPLYNEYSKPKQQFNDEGNVRKPYKRNMKATNFDQHVKIGNALNERVIIGSEDAHKKRSFEGESDNIPDLNKYKSEQDHDNIKVPSPLDPRMCKNVELNDRVLYVQPDESVDLTHILSPVKEKNLAIEFVIQNYKKCSLTDSSFQKNVMLLIDWSKTPVRLFGGAYPRTTTDLCGFF